MSRIRALEKLSGRRWIYLYEARYLDKKGEERGWEFVSRHGALKAGGAREAADAVVIVPTLVGPEGRRLVMIEEYRAPIDGLEWAFPAGLVDKGESCEETARRELREETGLEVTRVTRTSGPLYSSAGLSDEAAAMVFVECAGTPSTAGAEGSEDIQVRVLDYAEVCRVADDRSLLMSAKAWPVLLMIQERGHI